MSPLRLHYEERGNGPPLAVLHGLFGSLVNWRSIANRFSARWRVISVDLRNHGRSPHAPTQRYADMAGDVIDLLDALALPSVHLLGHSMGGKVAMQCALSYAGAVDKLVVVDVAPRGYGRADSDVLDALLSVEPSRYRSRTEVEAALASRVPDAAVRGFLMMGLTRGDQDELRWRWNLDAIASDRGAIAGSIEVDGCFEGPVLFVRGQRSDFVRDVDWPAITKLFPNAELATIDGAGHWVHTDAPERFCRVVEDFLAR
jgi:esterase